MVQMKGFYMGLWDTADQLGEEVRLKKLAEDEKKKLEEEAKAKALKEQEEHDAREVIG